MSSLIEQAARRLEQLKQAGVDLSIVAKPAPPPSSIPVDVPSRPTSDLAPDYATVSTAVPESTVESLRVAPAPISRSVTLDLSALAEAGLLTPEAPRSHIADQYRVIKRPLITNAMGGGAATVKHGNLIMVTSALAGEGKSFTSVNLAMSIAAELDNTVMLVDADVARPSVLRMLGLPPSPGLLDILDGSATMSEVLLRTNVDKLTILPSGTPHGRATELLASDNMRLLLQDMAKRYADRIIIFDSPPLLLTTESRVLATQMGQVVMVVQADSTLRADLKHALSTIDSCPLRMVLLNRASTDKSGGYGYGYGYGHGYGYGREKQAG